MSDDPFRELTAIRFLRNEKVRRDPTYDWVVTADQRIAIVWSIGIALAFLAFAFWWTSPMATVLLAVLAVLFGLSAYPLYRQENRTWPLEVRSDGLMVGPDRVRWTEVTGFEGVVIHAVSPMNGASLTTVRGLVLHTKNGSRAYPTWAELDDVAAVAERLETLRQDAKAPLPEDVKRVSALRKQQESS